MWENIYDYLNFVNKISDNKEIKNINKKNTNKEVKNKYKLCWNNSKIFEFGEIIN